MSDDVSVSTVLLALVLLQLSVLAWYAPLLAADFATALVDGIARLVAGVGFLFAFGFLAYAYRGPVDVRLTE